MTDITKRSDKQLLGKLFYKTSCSKHQRYWMNEFFEGHLNKREET